MSANLKQLSIHVWHLEMTSRPEAATEPRQYTLRQAHTPLPELNRFLYVTVGAPWMWYMRLKWTWQEWHEYLSRDSVTTYIAYLDATPIGYFELETQPNGVCEIAYFGLVPEFVSKGYGRDLLTDCIDKAFELAESRIWLHTCTLDHPNALPNYLGRGFHIFKEEDFEDYVPAEPLEPWPGADKPR